MTARSSWNQGNTRGHRPRLQCICRGKTFFRSLLGIPVVRVEYSPPRSGRGGEYCLTDFGLIHWTVWLFASSLFLASSAFKASSFKLAPL